MRTLMYLFIKQNCEILIEELNSVLALSNLMVITEKCTEYDSKVLVLILWQKLSELWVSIVFEDAE